MENLEKQFEQELSASRMQIELLRNQVLLQYYTQLLELDPLLQTQEVKAPDELYQHARTLRP